MYAYFLPEFTSLLFSIFKREKNKNQERLPIIASHSCPFILFLFLVMLQERRGGESSRSHRDYKEDNHTAPKLGDKQLDEVASDTSEAGDSSRSHNQPTRWR